jgi:hypothetical protein
MNDETKPDAASAAAKAGEDKEAANSVSAILSGTEDGTQPVLSAANAQDGWLRIVPWGEYPNGRHRQQVDAEGGAAMVNAMSSARAKVKKVFAWFTGANAALPVHLGHPDDPHFAAHGHKDKTQYASVPEMETRDDGLYGRVLYNEDGRKLLAAGRKLFFSPRWAMRELANGNFRPVEMLSLGLTPHPNIREAAAANQKTITMKPILKAIASLLGLAATDEQLTAAANATAGGETPPLQTEIEHAVRDLKTKAEKADASETAAANARAEATTLTAERDAAREGQKKAEGDVTAANARATQAETAAATTRKKAATELVNAALEAGRITKKEQPDWQQKFEANFETAANELSKIKVGAALTVIGRRPPAQRADATAANATRKLTTERNRRYHADPSRSQADHWNDMKTDPEFAGLFAERGAGA